MDKALSLAYKRKISSQMITFQSKAGQNLFKKGLSNGTMEIYFQISQQMNRQNQPQSCAAASLVPVLNALEINPNSQWKGIWSWYDEFNLKGIPKEQIMEPVDL